MKKENKENVEKAKEEILSKATEKEKSNSEKEISKGAKKEEVKAKPKEKEIPAKEKTMQKAIPESSAVSTTVKFNDVFLHPLVSEKAVDMIEKENKITFIVKKDADKALVKKLFEEEFKVKVDSTNIINDMKGRKKAIIKVNKQYKASDIAMKLGII